MKQPYLADNHDVLAIRAGANPAELSTFPRENKVLELDGTSLLIDTEDSKRVHRPVGERPDRGDERVIGQEEELSSGGCRVLGDGAREGWRDDGRLRNEG